MKQNTKELIASMAIWALLFTGIGFMWVNRPQTHAKQTSGFQVLDALMGVPGLKVYATLVTDAGVRNLVLTSETDMNNDTDLTNKVLMAGLDASCKAKEVEVVTIVVKVNNKAQISGSWTCDVLYPSYATTEMEV